MNWTKTTLKDFAPLVYGKGLPKTKRIPGKVPVYGSNGIVGTHVEAFVDEPAVIIGRKGSVGEVHLAVGPSWPIDTAFYALASKDVDLHFLYYLLKTLPLSSNSDSAVPGLNRDFAHSLEIQVPEINGQVAIGRILSSLDQKIAGNNAISKTLEDITQTIFNSWFINFDPVKAKMAGQKPVGMDAATAALFPDSMEESELGLVPKGWVFRSLFDCGLEIESGSRPKGGVKGFTSGVPSIGAESINGLGVFDFSKTKYIPRDFYDKMKKGKPKDFDVLLYKDGGKPGEFKPRVGMFGLRFPFSEFAINEHVFILRARGVGEPYLYFWVRLERTLEILRNRGIKAAIPGINQQDVGTLLMLQPSQEVLKAFNKMAMTSISMILTLANESLRLTNLRDILLPRLISGELQIPGEVLTS